MKWHKHGLIYQPTGNTWWSRNLYAFNPTATVTGDRVRIYFASLDDNNYGRIGYVESASNDITNIRYVSPEPVLDIGALGTFDDSGVNPSSVLTVSGQEYLYYIGWQRAERVPYMLFSGLAIGEDDGQTFQRHSPVPVFDRTADEPYSRSAAQVIIDNGRFRAWYWSCERWTVEGEWLHYNNVIRCAESDDGISWTTAPQICISPQGDEEYAVGRPWVVKDPELYRMWYSVRCRGRISYRLGYAESHDGLTWERKDEQVGLHPSAEGWDSEMVCCPCVVDIEGGRYMFYNGNRHGRGGFGCAVLESD
jgi:predicted GH43/DUF377 family glycosyl hydrolase